LEVFKKIWADSWGPRLEHILRRAVLVLDTTASRRLSKMRLKSGSGV
jgi:hypothetical protein